MLSFVGPTQSVLPLSSLVRKQCHCPRQNDHFRANYNCAAVVAVAVVVDGEAVAKQLRKSYQRKKMLCCQTKKLQKKFFCNFFVLSSLFYFTVNFFWYNLFNFHFFDKG